MATGEAKIVLLLPIIIIINYYYKSVEALSAGHIAAPVFQSLHRRAGLEANINRWSCTRGIAFVTKEMKLGYCYVINIIISGIGVSGDALNGGC